VLSGHLGQSSKEALGILRSTAPIFGEMPAIRLPGACVLAWGPRGGLHPALAIEDQFGKWSRSKQGGVVGVWIPEERLLPWVQSSQVPAVLERDVA
jgi:hypothetical protein